MALEIERKYLVDRKKFFAFLDANPELKKQRVLVKQGYLCRQDKRNVRVRITDRGAFLTIKGARSGITRMEFEYEIPVQDAEEMLNSLNGSQVAQNVSAQSILIEKYRYFIPQGNFTWEVDEFLGENKGLLMAEIELQSEKDLFDKPGWLLQEVSEDPRFFNAYLSENPFASWSENQ